MAVSKKRIRNEARQLFRLCLVNGILDEGRTRLFVSRIIEAKRRGYLDLLSNFEHLVRLDGARHTADVVSAEPLRADLRATVQARIEEIYGPGIDIHFADNPALIGGMRITVGSDVYDGSVQSRLSVLEKSF